MTNIEKLIFIYSKYKDKIIQDCSLENKEAKLMIAGDYYMGDNLVGSFKFGKQIITVYKSCNLPNHFICKYLLSNQIRVLIIHSSELIQDKEAVDIADSFCNNSSELDFTRDLTVQVFFHKDKDEASELGRVLYSKDIETLTVKLKDSFYNLTTNFNKGFRKYHYETEFEPTVFFNNWDITKNDIIKNLYYISIENRTRNVEHLFYEPNVLTTIYIDCESFYPSERYFSFNDKSVKYGHLNRDFKNLLTDFEITDSIKYFKGNKNNHILELIELNMEN